MSLHPTFKNIFSYNTVNLYSYLMFGDNSMCIAGPNNKLRWPKTTGIDANDGDLLNKSIFALFWTMKSVVGPNGDKIKSWRFFSYGKFGEKSPFVLDCWVVRRAIAFPSTYIDLLLVPNQTNEGVKKQWITQWCDEMRHIVTCLVTLRLCTFSSVHWQLETERGEMWGPWQLFNPLNPFNEP